MNHIKKLVLLGAVGATVIGVPGVGISGEALATDWHYKRDYSRHAQHKYDSQRGNYKRHYGLSDYYNNYYRSSKNYSSNYLRDRAYRNYRSVGHYNKQRYRKPYYKAPAYNYNRCR